MSRHTHVCVLVIVPKDVHLEEENIVKSKYNCIDKEKDRSSGQLLFIFETPRGLKPFILHHYFFNRNS